ncbi:MerR family DNA-binding transcriptional regulator [Actinophytocola algeriensis]|uniref:HTH merR-type domain-containing protein n=1 Tax=Actinophytocola algeriensis TaxID=1768010 RepID=A0A7W7VH79_9PSEU|nr:MerR family DNA-binding transcriptional regulator [Actinophytocola algeriensis]MBB4910141.1 hypothetical protein [Actinophytocola algeriensis]MBE1480871.1 hypothetical protein [Actinophytocola algeriensis]
MRVAELAAAAGVAPDTVRYYERTGLPAAPLPALRADLVHLVDSVTDGPRLDPEPGNWCAPREEVSSW